MKTINEVCIAIDNATEVGELCELHKGVARHKRKYLLAELEFMQEHFECKTGALARRDFAEIKETIRLINS